MKLMKRGLMMFAAWTAVALLFSIQMYYQTSSSTEPRTWSWILAWQLTGWWSWAVFTPPVWAFSAWAVRIRRPAQLIAAHLPMAIATAVLCAALEGGAKWALGLYRTLHTISAFVLEDPKQANRMIARLSELLRQSFNSERGPLVTLEEELELLDHYVAIQEARFGDRLRVTFRVDPRAASAVVPTLLLQPLVENAIRHGVAPETSVSEIEIAATREGDRLHLSVRDNGPGVHAEPKRGNGGGLGIANTRARLLELYGPSHRFELTNAPDSEGGGALATIEIPYSDHARDYR